MERESQRGENGGRRRGFIGRGQSGDGEGRRAKMSNLPCGRAERAGDRRKLCVRTVLLALCDGINFEEPGRTENERLPGVLSGTVRCL